MEDVISVRLNGCDRSVPSGSTLEDLLRAEGLDPKRVAVERNREVVPRGRLAEVVVADGDALEVVQFVGGG